MPALCSMSRTTRRASKCPNSAPQAAKMYWLSSSTRASAGGRRRSPPFLAQAARKGRQAAGESRQRAAGADDPAAGGQVAAADHGLPAAGCVQVVELACVAVHRGYGSHARQLDGDAAIVFAVRNGRRQMIRTFACIDQRLHVGGAHVRAQVALHGTLTMRLRFSLEGLYSALPSVTEWTSVSRRPHLLPRDRRLPRPAAPRQSAPRPAWAECHR